MKKRKLWLISEVFYPDVEIATGNIATEIAKKFSSAYEVHVICGPVGYGGTIKEPIYSLKEEDITIHRTKYFNLNKDKRIGRIVRILGISISFFIKGLQIKRNDKVFLISNPAFVLPFFTALKSIKGFQFTLLMHDVFPENLLPGGFIGEGNLLYKLTKFIFSKCRGTAVKIIVLGRDMKYLIEKSLNSRSMCKVISIPNWADIDNIYPIEKQSNKIRKSLGLENKIVIQFAGNHGILQNLLELVDIISEVDNSEVSFLFSGGGATKNAIMNICKERKLENVFFLPAFPRSELNTYQNVSDIGLVSLSDKVYGVGVPSKSYNILAAGVPILFLGNTETEIGAFVREEKVGWAFNYSEKAKIIAFFNELRIENLEVIKKKGEEGMLIVRKMYNKEIVLNELFDSLLDSPK